MYSSVNIKIELHSCTIQMFKYLMLPVTSSHKMHLVCKTAKRKKKIQGKVFVGQNIQSIIYLL